MAEGLTNKEIEHGIKQLINIGSTPPLEKCLESSDKGKAVKKVESSESQKSVGAEGQNDTSEKKKRNRRFKKKKNLESSALDDGTGDGQNPGRKGQQKKQNKVVATPQPNNGGQFKQSEEREVLKPGLIISVNEQSKRKITSYLNENTNSKPTPKGGKEFNVKDVNIEDKKVEDHKAKEESPKRLKKKQKKGKKHTDSSNDEDDYDGKSQTSEQDIDEAVKKFWSMKTNKGRETHGIKTQKQEKSQSLKHEKPMSGHEADDEKDLNEDLNLDLSDVDDDISVEILLKILERDRIFPLKKKSARFPRARFFCRACDYHMDTIEDIRRHGKDHRHQRRVENIKVQDELKRMCPPTKEHIQALDILLEEIYQQHHMTKEVLEERKTVVQNLETFLKKIIPDQDLKLQIFGSSLNGLGLVSSDVNVEFEVEKDHAKCLTLAFRGMKESDEYDNVISDFLSKVPCIYFTMKDVKYRITISSEPARNTSHLMKLYGSCDERFIKLAVVFRFWAKVCKIDRQDEGTLPAYSFSLLLIFYLQRCKPPVLPVLYQGSEESRMPSPTKNKQAVRPEEHVDFDEIAEIAANWKSENTESIGSLWLGLFRYYVLGFEMNNHVVCIRQLEACTRAQKKWNSKKLAIEDPFSMKRNVSKSVIGFELFEYIMDCVRKAYRYFGQPTNCKLLKQKRKKKHTDKHNQNKKVSDNSAEKLAVEENIGGEKLSQSELTKKNNGGIVVSSTGITSSTGVNKEGEVKRKNSNQEDEKSTKTVGNSEVVSELPQDENIEMKSLVDEKGVIKPETEDDKLTRDKVENIDINTAQIESQTISDKDNVEGHIESDHKTLVLDENSSEHVPRYYNTIATMSALTMTTNTFEKPSQQGRKSVTTTRDSYIPISSDSCRRSSESSDIKPDCDTSVKQDSIQTCDSVTEIAKCIVEKALSEAVVLLTITNSSHEIVDNLDSSDKGKVADTKKEKLETSTEVTEVQDENKPQYNYKFIYSVLTDGKGPSVFCSSCEKEGHMKHSCPDELIPELAPLPKMTKSHKEMMSLVLKTIPREYGPTEVELRDREMVRRELEEFIRELYPDSALHLFGSSYNGFGFRHSDLDLCVTFDKHPTGEDLDLVNCIDHICCKLKTHRGLYNVFSITTAKVPIVKFRHRRSQLEGDISMYNLLALQNTEMVRMYAEIDPRVRDLGFALKVFVKVCDIGDASRGSLSSYAYILMLLHYLQQCNPPVIPVLQELYQHYGPEKPVLKIDGWNAWYFDNLKTLPDVWLDYGKNKQTVGELWLGLFRYYTEEFNMKEQVVCCRQKQPLTKFEKLWNSPCIAIEDPFDMNHNLGGGISRKMQQYIHKAFIKGRELYGNPRPDLKNSWNVTFGYFFANDSLKDGPPPNDRCCRTCNKIGHIAKECPVVKNRKDREEKERKRKAEEKKKSQQQQHQQQGNHRESGNHTDRSGNHTDRSGNLGSPRDQGSYYRERVIQRTMSESHDHQQYYPSTPMSIPQSRQQTHRSMSLPASYPGHGQYSPMSSPQAYQGFSQNMSPLQHNVSQHYRPGPSNYADRDSGVTRSLFNQQQQYRPTSGRSPSNGGHQRQHAQNKNNNQQNRGNNSNTDNTQRNSQNPRQMNSMFRQAEQYYKQGPRH